MKTLPNLSLLFFSVFVFCSCSKYQYVTVQSNRPTQNEGIVIENDSVQIAYSFKGENCPVQIQVTNKLSIPIFIDWKKSALIVDAERFSYWQDKTTISASTRGYEIRWNNVVSTTKGTTTGELIRAEQVSFIPPHSFVTAQPLTVKDSFFKIPKTTKSEKTSISNGYGPIPAEKYTFTKNDAPLVFRSYLTLSTQENFNTFFHFDDEFWVSEIIPAAVSPSQLASGSNTQFSMRKSTGFASVMAVVIAIPVIIWASVSGSHSK